MASSDPGKVPLPAEPVVRITDLLDALNSKVNAPPSYSQRSCASCYFADSTINGIASTATAELLIDGVSVGVQQAAGSPVAWAVRPPPSSCVWPTNLSGVQCKGLVYFPAPTHAAACEAAACAADALVWQWAPEPGCWAGTPNELPCVPPTKPNPWVGGGRPVAWAPSHNATLLGRNASGAVVASHTVFVPSPLGVPPAALVLSLDVPAHATGTGERLVLDGQVCGGGRFHFASL